MHCLSIELNILTKGELAMAIEIKQVYVDDIACDVVTIKVGNLDDDETGEYDVNKYQLWLLRMAIDQWLYEEQENLKPDRIKLSCGSSSSGLSKTGGDLSKLEVIIISQTEADNGKT